MRPYIICHMTTSLDGKVTGEFLENPGCAAAIETYYELNRSLMAGKGRRGYACGRVTMEGSFTKGYEPDLTAFESVPAGPRMDYIADEEAKFFAVAFDRKGRLGWTGPVIQDEDPGYGGAHIVEVVTEQVSDAYLAYLRSIGVSYLIAGGEELDLPLALHKLYTILGIETLALEGGSILNGAFQRAGVIDELSLVVAPVVSGAEGKPLFEDAALEEYELSQLLSREHSVLWLNYKKK